MKENKTYTLLQTFNAYQLQAFDKFLKSPFFNERTDMDSLFCLIRECINSGMPCDEYTSGKQQYWEEMFGQTRYEDVKWRRIHSDLHKLGLKYLAHHQLDKGPVRAACLQLNHLDNSNLQKHFKGVVRQARNWQEKEGKNYADNYLFNFEIEKACHKHLERLGNKFKRLQQREFDNLRKADFYLDCYYVTQKLVNYCDWLGYRQSMQIPYELSLFPRFLETIEASELINEPLIKAYFLVAKMMIEKKEAYFFSLKKYLETHYRFFLKEDLYTLYIHLNNYCIDQKVNKGVVSFFKELFGLYKSMLNRDLLLEDGKLPESRYKNIIGVGIINEAYSWVEHFINEYSGKLPLEVQENATTYHRAYLEFYKENYSATVSYLQQVDYKILSYAISSRILLLRTYYEMDEIRALESLIDSFRIFLFRDSHLSKEAKQQYKNLLKFTKKLIQIPGKNREKVAELEGMIQNSHALAGKKWLLEKVQELS